MLRMAPSALRHRLRRDPLDEAGSHAGGRAIADLFRGERWRSAPACGGDGSAERWRAMRAALFAVDPAGLGGMLRAHAGPARDRWLALLRRCRPAHAAPLHRRGPAAGRAGPGGDAARRAAGGRRGLLAEAQAACCCWRWPNALPAVAAMAARAGPGRCGTRRRDRRRGAGRGVERRGSAPAPLLDRLAFHVDSGEQGPAPGRRRRSGRLRRRGRGWPASAREDGVAGALCETAVALGIDSLARAAAGAARGPRGGRAGRPRPGDAEDAALAARLVLAPRATRAAARRPPTGAGAGTAPEQADRRGRRARRARRTEAVGRRDACSRRRGRDPGRPARPAAGADGRVRRDRRARGRARSGRARPAGRGARRRSAAGPAAEPGRDPARGRPVAARARPRRRRPVQVRREDFRVDALRAAARDDDHLRGGRLRLAGAEPAGGGQGRGRAAAGRVLRAARPGGRAGVPRPRRRAAAAADALAGAGQAQPGGAARRRRHAARRGDRRRAASWPTRCAAAAARRRWCC